MKNCNKSQSIKSRFSKYFRLIIILILSLLWSNSIITASGGFDNGTATGKGMIGLDLTWNPFNYFPKGQSYAVLSYGFSDKFDFHSYYSHPASGSDNYYFGLFYQFYNNKFFDLATAIGIRQYNPKYERHLFVPQLLYTFHVFNDLRIGGSLVTLRDIDRKSKMIGTTVDIALIIPILKLDGLDGGAIESIDFCIGAFKPILWKPNNYGWHATYSFDIKFNL